ncbi:hypothetical protein FHL15_002122 [Xylaria flabelliformis]|uniref:Uncharacterized protein n=1 Tax=Xylaria flabelliformis TaxID=2512241 RepID=A0A553I9C5_9PEZI|nr:hypothetical protein FHL15_002122 [Xylaria flabelliformis]
MLVDLLEYGARMVGILVGPGLKALWRCQGIQAMQAAQVVAQQQQQQLLRQLANLRSRSFGFIQLIIVLRITAYRRNIGENSRWKKRPAADEFGKLPESAHRAGLHEGFKRWDEKSQSRDDAGSRVPWMMIGRKSASARRARLHLHPHPDPGEGKRWDEKKGHRGDRTKKGGGRLPASRAQSRDRSGALIGPTNQSCLSTEENEDRLFERKTTGNTTSVALTEEENPRNGLGSMTPPLTDLSYTTFNLAYYY